MLRFRTYHFKRSAVLLITVFIFGAVLYYWANDQTGEREWVNQVKIRELVMARAGALSVSEFLQHREDKLLLLADIDAIKGDEENEGRAYLRKTVDLLQGPLASIVRVDKGGRTLWSENKLRLKVEERIDVSDRDYFLWAKGQKSPGEIFLSKPIEARSGPSKGELVVAMATPLFSQEKFNGLVFMTIPLRELSSKFITPLLISPRAEVMIVADDGAIITSTNTKYLNRNAGTLFEVEGNASETFLKNEGSVVANYSGVPNKDPIKVIVGYSLITKRGGNWSLWVFIPYDEVDNLFGLSRSGLMGGFLLMTLGFILISLILIVGLRTAQKEGFLAGHLFGQNNRRNG